MPLGSLQTNHLVMDASEHHLGTEVERTIPPRLGNCQGFVVIFYELLIISSDDLPDSQLSLAGTLRTFRD